MGTLDAETTNVSGNAPLTQTIPRPPVSGLAPIRQCGQRLEPAVPFPTGHDDVAQVKPRMKPEGAALILPYPERQRWRQSAATEHETGGEGLGETAVGMPARRPLDGTADGVRQLRIRPSPLRDRRAEHRRERPTWHDPQNSPSRVKAHGRFEELATLWAVQSEERAKATKHDRQRSYRPRPAALHVRVYRLRTRHPL